MGAKQKAPKMDDPEAQPLMGVVSAKEEAMKEARQWKGGVHEVFGPTAEAQDVAACCLAFNAPPIALGWNSARGLGLSWWREALKFFLLTAGAFSVIRCIACCVVMMMCTMGPRGPPMMGPGHGMMGNPGGPMMVGPARGGMMGNPGGPVDMNGVPIMPMPIEDGPGGPTEPRTSILPHPDPVMHVRPVEPAVGSASQAEEGRRVKTAVLGVIPVDSFEAGPRKSGMMMGGPGVRRMKEDEADYASEEEWVEEADDDEDDDDNHHHHHHHDDDDDDDHHHHHHHDKRGKKDKKEEKDKKPCKHSKAMPWSASNEDGVTTSTWSEEPGNSEPGFPDYAYDDGDMMMADPNIECGEQAVGVLCGLLALLCASVGYGIYFAAKRRALLRERFGIPGTMGQDCALWACCGPCALAQETRTLMHNNVEEGLWHGPLNAPAPQRVA